jgi:hypothetical protein
MVEMKRAKEGSVEAMVQTGKYLNDIIFASIAPEDRPRCHIRNQVFGNCPSDEPLHRVRQAPAACFFAWMCRAAQLQGP